MRENNLMRILIFGIVFILFGCSEDLFDEQINQNNNIIARKISMQDIQFKSNEKLIQSVTNLKQIQLNTASKYEYSEVYDFYIDEENGVYLEKDSLESYTFPVYKTETDSIITNIVFNKNITGDFDVILAEYDILKNEFSDITPEELAQSDVEYTDITGKFRGPELICIETQEYQYTLEYTPEGGYNYVGHWYTTGSYCFWSDTGGGGGSDGIGSGTSSGGNTGGGILTGPVDSPHGGGGGSTPQSFPDTPCGKMQKKSAETAFRQNFKNLNTPNNFRKNNETGYLEKRDSNGKPTYQYVIGSENTSSLNPQPGMVAFMHVHNNQTVIDNGDGNVTTRLNVKMLSPSDIFVLIDDCANNAIAENMSPLDAYAVMISSEGAFSVNLENSNIALTGIIKAKMNFVFGKESSRIFNETSPNSQDRKDRLQKMLLTILKDNGLGDKVALYEAETEIEPGVSLPTINWVKKSLDANGNLVKTPC